MDHMEALCDTHNSYFDRDGVRFDEGAVTRWVRVTREDYTVWFLAKTIECVHLT